jgi:microcin C transport system substrate-binding protein
VALRLPRRNKSSATAVIPLRRRSWAGVCCALAIGCISCGGQPPAPSPPRSGASAQPAASNISFDKNAYPVFPERDAGADPSVPAEQGGKGFSGDGWQTNTSYDLIGDPRAVKGGIFRQRLYDFPNTLRMFGPESNTVLNYYVINRLVYEPLLWLHPTTLEFIPALATHWQISPDKMTYRFRINPNARWSDGEPVVADDVVATWMLIMDKGLQAPMDQLVFEKFEKPVAESKYIVRVKSKQRNWRNFLYIATNEGTVILPSHVLKNVNGATYQRDYNFKLLPGTGPFTLSDSDVVKGKSLSLRRRNGYWAENERRNIGRANFDELRFQVVRDENLAFEMLKKGDIDFRFENVSKRWVEEMNFDKVQRGLIQKRKIYNDNPSGTQGIGLNMRKPPFDDIRVRQAMAHLLNRELLIRTLFFNEYPPLNSYFAGGIYENRQNPKMEYDPQLALKLLSSAGWNARDAQGRLVKDGRAFSFELLYSDKASEKWMTVYQDDLRKVGITMNLRLVTEETRFQLQMERKFDAVSAAWAATTFPNPETEYSSKLADVNNTNNITGIKDKRIDQLLDEYDLEFDQHKREAIIREIDGILANIHPYVLAWDAPFQRIAYWNKFGQPRGYLTRIDDYYAASSWWWIDSQKERELLRAVADPSIKMDIGPLEDRYWQEYGRSDAKAAGATVGAATK